jgi:hypothetical protein
LSKQTTHYKDLDTALLAPKPTVLQDLHDKTCKPEHLHAENKRKTRILDANYEEANLKEIVDSTSAIDTKKRELLNLLKKYEHLFDGNLGKW